MYSRKLLETEIINEIIDTVKAKLVLGRLKRSQKPAKNYSFLLAPLDYPLWLAESDHANRAISPSDLSVGCFLPRKIDCK